VSNQTQSQLDYPAEWLLCWFRVDRRDSRVLATALAGTAFDADAACAGADDFVAAADRTSDPHEDAAERDHDAIIMPVAIPAMSCSTKIGRRVICDHVDHLFVAGASQIGDRPVESLLLDLADFLER
jgi:hypothetical protein